jgi:serine phosphatase RsbU (regulator of sigma subunit)
LEAEILLWELNRNLHQMLPTGMFCAAVLMELIPQQRGCTLRIWNGGMEDVLICRPQRGMIHYVCSSHLALGILGTDSFSPDFEHFSLEPGDHVLAYSDGLTEAMDERGEPFGRERVEEAVRVSFYSGESFDGVIEALRQFRGGAPQVDDILLVSMHCTVAPSSV